MFDVTSAEPLTVPLDGSMADRQMFSIPVLNQWNPNHVHLVVNLFRRKSDFPVSSEELFRCGTYIGQAVDRAVDTLCSSAAGRVGLLAGQAGDTAQFLSGLVGLIVSYLDCEGASIFLINDAGDRLNLAATSGIAWSGDDRSYRVGEEVTGAVWAEKKAIFTVGAHGELQGALKSHEVVLSMTRYDCMLMPMIKHTGEVIGVIRCRNKRPGHLKTLPRMFTDDDSAVLDALAQAAISHLIVLESDRRRKRVLSKLTHELKMPLVAIRSAADTMKRRVKSPIASNERSIDDILSWAELMSRLLNNTDLLRYEGLEMKLRPTRTLLLADVVIPSLRCIELLSPFEELPPQPVSYSSFESIPALWIDRNQFQQVVFNLLSNAVKYSTDDRGAFRIDICASASEEGYQIVFRDWGVGIEPQFVESIFGEGFRTPKGVGRNVSGQGLGLWVVRQIVQAHGGTVFVSRNLLPTELTVTLPLSLANMRPTTHAESTTSE
jgi:signal transduction histidine kinase